MPLRPQVFPQQDVTAAGLLEKQNRETRAALEAASFIESFSVFGDATVSFSGTGLTTVVQGNLTGRVDQYIQFVGSLTWLGAAALQSIRVMLFLNGNNQPALQFGYAQKDVSPGGEAQTLPLHAFLKLPLKSTPFLLAVNVGGGGSGQLITVGFGYFRFKEGPK